MDAPAGSIRAYRRLWLPELLALGFLAAATTVLFGLTNLDLVTVRPFYHPELRDPWPVAEHPVWWLCYRSAPFVTGVLAVTGAAVLVLGVIRKGSRRFRLHGLFILLAVIVGPGVIVNGVLKDHWGRPRPRQLLEFGGRHHFAPPLAPVGAHGKSFPCGHCSVGYLYAIGWWLWRRRRPWRAAASLVVGLSLGTVLGIGRMAAGAHFLSDAIWAGLIALGVAHVLYFYVLRIPAREDSREPVFGAIERSPRRRALAVAATTLLGAAVVGGGILASPDYQDLTSRVAFSDYPSPPQVMELVAGVLDVELRLEDEPRNVIEVSGDIHGFGLPTNDVSAKWEHQALPIPTLRYLITERGWFTDLDGLARVSVPAADVKKVVVRLGRGDITVIDARTPRAGRAAPLPELDLQTADGRITRP